MSNRVALVTGGSRGIGRACAIRLAANGFDVAFCGRKPAPEVAAEIEAHGVRALAVEADVSDGAAVRAMVTQVGAELGPLDVLVTSAGITADNPLVLMSDEQWRSVMAVNLDGVYNACRAAVFEMMKRRSGAIITISSVAGVHGNARQANYAAAKAGIIGFTRSLAKEVGRYGIRVNAVAPGFVDTDMTAALDDRMRAGYVDAIPLGRFGHVDEVAGLVAFLAGAEATYITGSVLHVDGGLAL